MSQLTTVRSILSDMDHYNACRQTYSISRVKWLTVRVPRWMNQTFTSVLENMEFGSEISPKTGERNGHFGVLSVGSGAGEVNHMMIDRLLGKFPAINCTIIEPGRKEMVKYQKLVSENSEKLKNVAFQWYAETFETYYERNLEDKFNLIECIETMYYFNDYEGVLQKMYDSLAPNGVMLIVLAAANAGYHNLWKHHGEVLRDDNMNFVSAADIKDTLRKNGIPFSTTPDKYRVDISEVFVEGSEVGDQILDFLTQIYHFRQTTPENIKNDLISLLKSEKCSEIVDGKIFFNNTLETIIVKKIM
ncbi:histamine N-methyltransferase A-like [Glandiceps talaboti]